MIAKRFLKLHVLASTVLLIALSIHAFSEPSSGSASSDTAPPNAKFDEITVNRINVLDSEGHTRVTLAGGYPPRRADLSGLLFHHKNGSEAGGLVYYGQRQEDGAIQAGAILTFDQFQEDQILAIE